MLSRFPRPIDENRFASFYPVVPAILSPPRPSRYPRSLMDRSHHSLKIHLDRRGLLGQLGLQGFAAGPEDAQSGGRLGRGQDLHQAVLGPVSRAGVEFAGWAEPLAELQAHDGADARSV